MFWNKLFIWSMIINGLLFLEGNQAKIIRKRGVMDNLNDGLKVAGQIFGINTAADVANLVAKAFSKVTSNRNKPDLFSLIQKGLHYSPSTHSSNSEEGENSSYSEFQENQNQSQETTAFKNFQTKSTSATPLKEKMGVNFSTSNIITSMLRMVGFDATKLGALAINALIMIASAIGSTIMGITKSQPVISVPDGGQLFNKYPPSTTTNSDEHTDNSETGPEEKYSPNDHGPRTINDPTTIDWFLQNPSSKMQRILKETMERNLVEKLIDMITSYETEQGGQAACLKMLVCKSSPFIWGMQNSIKTHIVPQYKGKENININREDKNNPSEENSFFNTNHFFTHLPSIEEYREHGEKCEKLYSIYCNTTDLYTLNN